jgi:hypothetical protein
MGHILCLDLFGPPSVEEAAAGMTMHGEASVNEHIIEVKGEELVQRTRCIHAGLDFTRHIRLSGSTIGFHETVRNVSRLDRPVAWTEHVTVGPPFLEKGITQFRAPVTKSQTSDEQDFKRPYLPKSDGSYEDLQVFTSAASSARFSTHLVDPNREDAWFLAWSPTARLLFGYVWRRSDFPWLARWEENRAAQTTPWNARTLALGLEFGASPMSETRRLMIERKSLFDVPAYRWMPAQTDVSVQYCAFVIPADKMPDKPPVLP